MMSTTTTVSFPSRDGLSLNGTLEETSQPAKAAALLVHGIHSEQHESGFYTQLAESLAANSISSLRFDWRSQGTCYFSTDF